MTASIEAFVACADTFHRGPGCAKCRLMPLSGEHRLHAWAPWRARQAIKQDPEKVARSQTRRTARSIIWIRPAMPSASVEMGMTFFPKLSAEQLARLDVSGPRYTSYPTVPEWHTDFQSADLEAALRAAAAPEQLAEPLALYVHLPFCEERCTFCGCNVVVTQNPERADVYLDYLRRELELSAPHLGDRRLFGQLHFGGGTPTFLSVAQLQALWAILRTHFEPTPNAEIAIEVDPVVTTAEQIACLAELGFNRISMGVQDFDPKVQAAIKRIQTVEETDDMVRWARERGFSGVNFDLIYGLPEQTEASWAKTMEDVLRIRPDRLAVYSFAYLPDVRRNQRVLPIAGLPSGEAKLKLLEMAYNALVGAGYRAIGMDHFALPEDELAKAQASRSLHRNFQGYTARPATDSVAIGMTGISDVQGRYSQALPQLNRYFEAIDRGELPVQRGIKLSEDDLRRRRVITQLMCNLYVDLGEDAAEHFAPEIETLKTMEELVEFDGRHLSCTPLGGVFVRNVAMVFDAYLKTSQHRFSRTV